MSENLRELQGYYVRRHHGRFEVWGEEGDALLCSAPEKLIDPAGGESALLATLLQVYEKGRGRGTTEGRIQLQCELRRLLGAGAAVEER